MAAVVPAVLAAGAAPAWATPCAQVSGDPALAGAVTDLLVAHGVSSCPALQATVEHRGDDLAVVADAAGGLPLERVVGDVATAATVIESWARADVADPLLAVRPVAALELAAPHAGVVALAPSGRGIQAFAGLESSIASDRTSWLGPQVGACVMVGPVCAGARVRFARVVDGPGQWEHQLDRAGSELLVGGDVPIRVGRATISPGFGGGIGMIRTHVASETLHMASETGGLRADAHVAASLPLGHHLALDLTLAIDVTEATHVETNTTMQFPDEPWLLGRIGVGVRYGGP